MAHVPLMVHPNPKRVLVIGGGDGGTAREVLRHPQIEKCVMVEIDQLVVDACKEHIPQTASVFGHPKLELIIGDGVDYVAQYKKGRDQKFDVILVDSTDPVGPAQPLFGPEFYQNIYDCLADDGIVVSQGESPYYHQEMQRTLIKIIWEKFPVATLLNFHNMTYPGGLWSFSFGSKKYHPERDFRPSGLATIKGGFRYYNENVHRACFALPNFQLENVGQFLKI